MKRISKAVGLGFGIALSSGAMLSPAEARPTHADFTQHAERSYERAQDYTNALGFLALGTAITISVGALVKRPIKEKWFDTESDPYLMSEVLSMEKPLPKYHALSDGLEDMARGWREMQELSMEEFEAEWIAFQAARTEEL